MFRAIPIPRESAPAVQPVYRVVKSAVRSAQPRRHGVNVVEVGQRRVGEFRPRVVDRAAAEENVPSVRPRLSRLCPRFK
jgi:hypothetical protein